MGVCGADPVAIVDGMDGLSPPEKEELNTLRRLGLGKSTRMACCARIIVGHGDGLADAGAWLTETAEADRRYDRSIVSVVVIGNGIAGVTAADFIRRGHPDCEIHIVGQRDARAVQPDGDIPAGLRPFGDAGPVPAAGAVVRRARRACVAEHAGTPDRPALAAGAARHGGRVAVRPADSGDGRECGRPRDRRARPAGQFRAAGGRRRDANPRVRPAARLSRGRGRRRRAARLGGGLLAATSRVERHSAGAGFAAAEQAGRCAVLGVGRCALRKGGNRSAAAGRDCGGSSVRPR